MKLSANIEHFLIRQSVVCANEHHKLNFYSQGIVVCRICTFKCVGLPTKQFITFFSLVPTIVIQFCRRQNIIYVFSLVYWYVPSALLGSLPLFLMSIIIIIFEFSTMQHIKMDFQRFCRHSRYYTAYVFLSSFGRYSDFDISKLITKY